MQIVFELDNLLFLGCQWLQTWETKFKKDLPRAGNTTGNTVNALYTTALEQRETEDCNATLKPRVDLVVHYAHLFETSLNALKLDRVMNYEA